MESYRAKCIPRITAQVREETRVRLHCRSGNFPERSVGAEGESRTGQLRAPAAKDSPQRSPHAGLRLPCGQQLPETNADGGANAGPKPKPSGPGRPIESEVAEGEAIGSTARSSRTDQVVSL